MKQKIFDVFILILMLLSLNLMVISREVGMIITKSHNYIDYYSEMNKSLKFMALSYIDWCYGLAEKVINSTKELNTGNNMGLLISPINIRGAPT